MERQNQGICVVLNEDNNDYDDNHLENIANYTEFKF